MKNNENNNEIWQNNEIMKNNEIMIIIIMKKWKKKEWNNVKIMKCRRNEKWK